MADHVTALHAGDDAAIDMRVGAADGAGSDLDDRVAAVLDPRVRHALAAYVSPCRARSALSWRPLLRDLMLCDNAPDVGSFRQRS